MSARSRQGLAEESLDFSKDNKKKKNQEKSSEKIERSPSRRLPTPPEEKMKRGRGLVVFLLIFSVFLSYVFSLMRESR